jgi:lysophospholipase L1-like esterase
MASRKKASARGSRSARRSDSVDLREAIALGKRSAKEIEAVRKGQRRTRARALRGAAAPQRLPVARAVSARAAATLGAFAAVGTLIAEGDSWFDYPLHDVLDMLEDAHGYDVESVAHKGDRVEDMAFAPGQLLDFSRRLEKLLQRGTAPRAILLSGGGNDIAGAEFGVLLNHAASPIGGLNDDVVTGVIDKRAKIAYTTIISAISAISQQHLGHPLPTLIHGYDFPVPDGRGFFGGFGALPGPWLEPGFREKGFDDLRRNTVIMQTVIDRFNDMLQSVAAVFAHVHYIDLRRTLVNDAQYKRYWANELHPTKAGFKLVAAKFAAVLDALP